MATRLGIFHLLVLSEIWVMSFSLSETCMERTGPNPAFGAREGNVSYGSTYIVAVFGPLC